MREFANPCFRRPWFGDSEHFDLILTLFLQLRKQGKARSSQGVSKWRDLGQVLAEVGFVADSVLGKTGFSLSPISFCGP